MRPSVHTCPYAMHFRTNVEQFDLQNTTSTPRWSNSFTVCNGALRQCLFPRHGTARGRRPWFGDELVGDAPGYSLGDDGGVGKKHAEKRRYCPWNKVCAPRPLPGRANSVN